TGLTLVNEGYSTGVSANGPVSILAKADEVYHVEIGTAPSGPLQGCYVVNGEGAATASGNAPPFTVICGTPYTVGGTITGLVPGASGPYLGLELESLSVSGTQTELQNGRFRFTTPLAKGQPYQVIVNSLPNGENCNVTNGSGTITRNVRDVRVACAPC